jgi:hypothetical protein
MLSVDYSNGRLSINARGARLSDVFQALHRSTGARISGPTSAEELVSANICGAPDEVIADLLNGSALQYIVVLSTIHTGEIEELILSEREALKPSPVAAQSAPSLQAAPIPRGAEVLDSARARDADGASSARTAVPDSISAPVVTTNSGVSEGWKPVQTAPPPTDPGASASNDTNKLDSTDNKQQLNPAGQYLQEMYRLRQQVPQGSEPTSH